MPNLNSISASFPRRIFFASLVEAYWGGSEVLWSEAALAARAAGWQVAASFPYYKTLPQTRRLEEAGVTLFYGTRPPTRWWRRLLSPTVSPFARFQQGLDRFAPELVVINQGAVRDGLAEMAECRRRGFPYVILNQSVEPLYYWDGIWKELRAAFTGAHHAWCMSDDNLARLRQYLILPLDHAEVIPNAYGCPYDVACPWPADSDTTRLAVVARLAPIQKGHDLLLGVLASPRWRDRKLEVTFFGDGEAYEQLETRRAALGLGQVHIPGKSAKVADIWPQHHALVLPSRFEGQSLAMIEAMLHARPVIATPVGGTTGYVIDGQTGFLADNVTSGALDAVLERAWVARHEWVRLGENAARLIRQRVSPSPGHDLVQRLARVLAAPSTPPIPSKFPAS